MASLSSPTNVTVTASSNAERLSNLLVSAKAIRSRKVVAETKALYSGKMKVFYEWLNRQPELKEQSIDEEAHKVILPLPVENRFLSQPSIGFNLTG